MPTINSVIVLKALVKHETLTFPDLLQEKNLGVSLDEDDVSTALQHLEQHQLVGKLAGTTPTTYTITSKGIEEDARLNIDVP